MRKTTEYFETSVEILQSQDENGYTKEECWILDETAINSPFYNSLDDANESAAWHRARGLCIWDMLEMTDGRIAILAA